MIFIDSDVLIAHQRGDQEATDALEALAKSGETLATTSINVGELFTGAERSTHREAAVGSVLMLLDQLVQVPFGPSAARRFGTVTAALYKAGKPIPPIDGMIAAVVLENGGRLVSRNERHFKAVHGLEILKV